MSDNEKKVSAAQRKATDKYLENFDEIRIRLPKGQKAVIKSFCESHGKSMNEFVKAAIDQAMLCPEGFTWNRSGTEGEQT